MARKAREKKGPKKSSDLKPDPKNPRQITTIAQAGLERSLTEFGDLSGITFNKRTGQLVCGHQRVSSLEAKFGELEIRYNADGDAWIDAGDNRFSVRIVDWPASKQNAANLAANNTAIQGEFNELLHLRLVEVREEDDDLYSSLLFERLESAVDEPDYDDIIDDDDIPDPPDDPVTKQKDLWLLGDHKLFCGDSSILDDVKHVFADGKTADAMVTDPPYGVNYTGKTKDALKISNDDVKEEDLAKLVGSWFDVADEVTRPGAYWIATVPSGPLHSVFLEDWKRRGFLRQVLVWVKDSMVLGRSEYHYRHEPILFGWKPGRRLKNDDRTRTSVWEFDRPKRSLEHPTMKPIALWEYAIKNHTRRGDTIYEPFGGSGTSFVAAEHIGRKCVGLEISPRYCDVIVARWEKITGRKAELVR